MGIANRKIESFVSEAARLDIRERESLCAWSPGNRSVGK